MDQNPVPEVNNIPPPVDKNPEEVLPVKPSFTGPTLLMSVLIVLLLVTSAFLYFQNADLRKQNAPLQTTSALFPTPNPIASLKTYKNEEYGFEFKYPQSWRINNKELSDNTIFNLKSDIDSGVPYGPIDPPPTSKYFISVGMINNVTNLNEWITNDNGGIKNNISIMKDRSFTYYKITDIPSMSGQLSYYIQLKQKNSYLSLILFPYSEDEEYKNQNEATAVMNQILSTLKVLKPMTQIPANSQILLSVLNRPDGNNTPIKMLFDYQRKSDDGIFLIEDQSSEGIQEGFIIQRGVISLKVTPQFEGFPWAHTDSLVVEIDNPKLTSEKIFRTVAEVASDGYEYVTNYSAGSECGEPKIGTVACSLSNVSSNEVDLNIVCNSSAANVFECDQIVKTLTFSWQ